MNWNQNNLWTFTNGLAVLLPQTSILNYQQELIEDTNNYYSTLGEDNSLREGSIEDTNPWVWRTELDFFLVFTSARRGLGCGGATVVVFSPLIIIVEDKSHNRWEENGLRFSIVMREGKQHLLLDTYTHLCVFELARFDCSKFYKKYDTAIKRIKA